MTKFVYRMQNILDLKLKLEEQAKIAFSMANGILRQEEEKLHSIYIEQETYQRRLQDFRDKKLDLLEMNRLTNAIEIKKIEIEEQKKRIQLAKNNVEVTRRKLNDVMVERKTQEILKEKAFERYRQELKEEEDKANDELTSYQYNENGKEIEHA